MKRALTIALAVLCLGAGVVLLLLATDVGAWQRSFAGDDVRFRVAADRADLWRPSTIVPFGAARELMGVNDDLAYRRAVRLFRLGRPRELSLLVTPLVALRGQAQKQLQRIGEHDSDAARRSAAENFVGALAFASAAIDTTSRVGFLKSGVVAFQRAIGDDPGNGDAKYNLELALSRLHAAQLELLQNRRAAGQTSKSGKGAGANRTGSGY